MAVTAHTRVRQASDRATPEIPVPIAKLFRSPLNVRKQGGTNPSELAASILSHGVLQNLVVTPEMKKSRRTGRYAVVAGGRRLEALTHLVRDKRIPSHYPVRCIEVSEAEAIEISLAENTAREPLHPAD